MSTCSQTAPHDPHFYATFLTGGAPGPVPVTTRACPGLTEPTDRPLYQGAAMTWLTTWPGANMPAEHDTEAAAERHAAELVRTGKAEVATAYWHTDTTEEA